MKGGHLQMITISLQTIYYALGITIILCTSAYKIGYMLGKDIYKEKSNCPRQRNYSYFLKLAI
jgi:hypothetical protein